MLTHVARNVLQTVWNLLAEGKVNSIRAGLHSVSLRYLASEVEVKYLQNFITDSLEGNLNLEEWQMHNGFGIRSVAQLRRDQIAWIKWMLEV